MPVNTNNDVNDETEKYYLILIYYITSKFSQDNTVYEKPNPSKIFYLKYTFPKNHFFFFPFWFFINWRIFFSQSDCNHVDMTTA